MIFAARISLFYFHYSLDQLRRMALLTTPET